MPSSPPEPRARRRALPLLLGLATLVAVAAAVGGGWWWRERQEALHRAIALTGGGDPGRGRALIRPYGCAGCHAVPGVAGAGGKVGPSLEGIAARVYLAGVLENTPSNLVRWIEDPRAVDPRTAMPRTGASGQDARDIAAYLYTLR
jgi:cytochrome c